MNWKILILCTGNSCRSQMAEAILQSFDVRLNVTSAGTEPAEKVNDFAIQVMQEIGLDISQNKPKNVSQFLSETFDYVITVCDGANENCPVFSGKVKKRLHIGFRDPAQFKGTEAETVEEFRQVRDEIQIKFYQFFVDYIVAEDKAEEERKAQLRKKNLSGLSGCNPTDANACSGCSGCDDFSNLTLN